MISCTLGPLAKCSARELIRVKADRTTAWAIVGAQEPRFFPLIFLTGDNAPFVINVVLDPGDFERYPVAKYGTDYRFVHDPTGPSQIGDDELSRTAGSLVLTEDGEWHLLVNDYNRKGAIRWLHLASGKVVGERGSHKIAFADWSLCIKGLTHEPSEATLLSHATWTDAADDDDSHWTGST